MRTFGIPVLIGFSELRPNLDLCRELGMDFVELNMNLPYSFPENIGSRDIKTALGDGMRFSMHLHDDLDLGSLQPSVRRGHIERCEEALRWGSRHSVFLINLHLNPGVHFTLPDRKVWVYERFLDEHIESLSGSLERLSSLAASLGIRICLENTGHFAHPFMRKAAESVIDLPSVGLCWDIGHDGRSGLKEEDFMLSHLDRVWHMHFHDWDGKSDHQVPFTGTLQCDRYLRLAEEKGMSVLIEVKTEEALRSAVSVMRERGCFSSQGH